MKRAFAFLAAAIALTSCGRTVTMVTTTADKTWDYQEVRPIDGQEAAATLTVNLKDERQTIQGFGTAFSEMSFEALSHLSEQDREDIYHELFYPGAGANFTINRTPLGANDFSLKYYSYDDVDGDFAMEHFSIENDRSTLIPSIKAALAQNPDLKIWASPWCPPAWMKTNKHYATRPMRSMRRAIDAAAPRPGGAPGQGNGSMGQQAVNAMKTRDMSNVILDNGITPEQVGNEGMMMFTPDEKYFKPQFK